MNILLNNLLPTLKREVVWTDIGKYRSRDSQVTFSLIHGWLAFGGPAMLTKMTEEDGVLVLNVFDARRSRRGDKGRDDRKS